MWIKQKWIAASLLVAASALSMNQAQARGNDEAAILVGVAVGGLTAYALSHANDHHRDRYGSHHERHEYRERPRRHCPPKRVEHVVIHNPPQYREREYERVSYRGDNGYNRGRNERGGYEYQREYSRRGSF